MTATRLRDQTTDALAKRLSWSNPAVRGLVWQVLVVGAVLAVVGWLALNTYQNLVSRRIASGFDFLFSESGLPIGEHLISYSPTDTYFRALLVGALNTLRVAVMGIVLATVLGIAIGLARLSRHWLLAKLTALYVEVFRNLPLLLHLLLIYALLQALPPPRAALTPLPGVYLSNRGLVLPILEWSPAHNWCLAALALGVAGTLVYGRWTRWRQAKDGQPRRVAPVALVLIVGLPTLAAILTEAPLSIVWPELRGFNFRGGTSLSPEYFALLLGLVLYTAAFIAEIVRAGVLSVHKGQWEAAQALGLPKGLILRKIVLPQALRMIIPPLINQYLNLTKNSSLAVAIGYQDIVSVANTTINQTGQAIEGIAIIMAVYLTISLSISLFMNWYDRRTAWGER